MPIAAAWQEGALASRHVSHVCKQSIAMPIARRKKNHWPKHKAACKQRAAELRDEALFKDPPPKEDCPICFLPTTNAIQIDILCLASTRDYQYVPIYDFAEANKELANLPSEQYYA